MTFDELTAACIREVAELERRLEHTRQWNAARWERLSQWAREELPEPLNVRFFNILANGTADHMESPTLTQQYNVMKHRAEKAESELVRLRAADPGREYRELLLLAAADLESWMKSYHRDAATADTVKRLRDAALGVPETRHQTPGQNHQGVDASGFGEGVGREEVFIPSSACRGDPGECAHNGACMYACGVETGRGGER